MFSIILVYVPFLRVYQYKYLKGIGKIRRWEYKRRNYWVSLCYVDHTSSAIYFCALNLISQLLLAGDPVI